MAMMIVAANNKKHNTRMVFFPPHLSMLGRLAITLIITIPLLSQQHHTCLAFAVAATSAASASSSSSSSSSSFTLSGSNSHGRRRSTSTSTSSSSSRLMQHIEEDKQQQQRAEQDETKQEALGADTDTKTTLLDLHSAQTRGSPAQTLHDLATFCENEGIDTFDVYGDFPSSKTSNSGGSHIEEEEASSSYLRAFESEIATTFGKQDAVFMPSGVMAQSIALLIHASSSSSSQTSSSSKKNNNNSAGNSNGNRNNGEQSKRKTFACHRTSHLLLHENEGYADLLHMMP